MMRRAELVTFFVGFIWSAAAGCGASDVRVRFPQIASAYETLVARSPLGAADDTEVLVLTSDVRGWLDENIGLRSPANEETLRQLAKAFGPDGELELRYEDLGIYDASETFQNSAGNCLAFTHLFIAMSRELGIDARYQEVVQVPEWTRVGDYVIRSRHIIAYVEVGPLGSFHIDFGQRTYNDDSLAKLISDDRARAQHFNNLGASAMIKGRTEEAIRDFNRALIIDKNLAFVWANLGTVYLNIGELPKAEWALRESIRLDAFDIGALRKLVRLYNRVGDTELAEYFARRADWARFRNPFARYESGLAKLSAAQAEEAIEDLEASAQALPDLMPVHMHLGKAYHLVGRSRDARQAFRVALKLADSREARARLAMFLQELQ